MENKPYKRCVVVVIRTKQKNKQGLIQRLNNGRGCEPIKPLEDKDQKYRADS